jgi:hypothetical protein
MVSVNSTLMPFECPGIWWLPGKSPDAGTAGILRFTPEAGLILDLIGTLSPSTSIFTSSPRYEIIHGFAKGLPLGSVVTLVDAFRSTISMASPGLSTETLRANRAYVGEHLATHEQFQMSGAEIHLSHLSNWVAYSGLDCRLSRIDDTTTWNIEYRSPDSISADINGTRILVDFGANLTRASREITIREQVSLRVAANGEMAADTINSEFVHPLQNLLSFATDRPNAITTYRFFRATTPEHADWSEPVYLIYKPVYVDRTTVEPVYEHEMLFSFRDVPMSFEQLLTRWFELYSDIRPSFDVYFSYVYGSTTYVEPKFLSILQAIRLYTEARFRVSQKLVTEKTLKLKAELLPLPPGARSLIESHLRPHEDEVLRGGLHELIAPLQDAMASSLGSSTDVFVDEVVSLWDQITHRRGGHAGRGGSGAAIHWKTQRLSYLFKAAILREIGFDIPKITELFERNRRFVHLAAVEKDME